ncbi:MAG: FAD-dependent oxidoreductase, partial [Actinomycetota bacterium]
RTVTVIHRRDELRASKIMQERAFGNDKISFVWDTVVEEAIGTDGKLDSVRLRNVKTDVQSTLPAGGLFIAVGHDPQTKLFEGQIDLDPAGYVVVHDGSRTSVEGVFAGGDCVDHTYRQAVTAAGMGCMAAIDAERWLEATSEKTH